MGCCYGSTNKTFLTKNAMAICKNVLVKKKYLLIYNFLIMTVGVCVSCAASALALPLEFELHRGITHNQDPNSAAINLQCHMLVWLLAYMTSKLQAFHRA